MNNPNSIKEVYGFNLTNCKMSQGFIQCCFIIIITNKRLTYTSGQNKAQLSSLNFLVHPHQFL